MGCICVYFSVDLEQRPQAGMALGRTNRAKLISSQPAEPVGNSASLPVSGDSDDAPRRFIILDKVFAPLSVRSQKHGPVLSTLSTHSIHAEAANDYNRAVASCNRRLFPLEGRWLVQSCSDQP